MTRILRNRWVIEFIHTLMGCILVLMTFWGYNAWSRHRVSSAATTAQKPVVQNGSSVTLDAVDFSQSPLSLLVVTSPTCRYCLASEHFHSRLVQDAHAVRVPVYVIIPAKKDASQYLAEVGINDTEVREYRQMSIAVSGTPTVLGLDSSGHVRATWAGLANPADELEMSNLLKTRSFASEGQFADTGSRDLEPQELANIRSKARLNVVDLRERQQVPMSSRSINLPLQELPFRASRELDRTKLQVLDCTNILYSECKSALRVLKQLQFNTATLGAGTYHKRCKATPMEG